MGRREKDTNVTAPTAAFGGGSDKRTYTRQNTISVDHAELIKTNNITELETSKNNLNANDSQLSNNGNASNGLGRARKISARRSIAAKRNSDEEDFVPEPSTSNRPDVPSTINQRPRRQVKHKFIKTGNRKSVTDELYTALIGPNSPSAPALVPVVERLSDNISNLAELLAIKELKLIETNNSLPTSTTMPEIAATRAQKTLGVPVRRRGERQTRTSSSAQFEMNLSSSDAPVAMAINTIADNSIVTNDTFDEFPNANDIPESVDYANEVVIEETVMTTEFDHKTFDMTCDDAVETVEAAVESDDESIAAEEPNDIIDVSDSLSFLNDSDDNRSIDDARLPSSQPADNLPANENEAIDIDENSGSIIIVSPSDPLDDNVIAVEVVASTIFESHYADDDTANDGDVDELPLNVPRRRFKRKSKSVTAEENSLNSDAIDGTPFATTSIDSNKPADFSSLNVPVKGNTFYESNINSESTIEPPLMPSQANLTQENLISSSEDTTQSESTDRSGAFDPSVVPRGRRDNAERINYSVRRNYVSKQSLKNNMEFVDAISDNFAVDFENELEKSVIERPQPPPPPAAVEPKFKLKKSEQMRTYQRRQKVRGTKKASPSSSAASESPSPSPSSSSSSMQSLMKIEHAPNDVTAQKKINSSEVVAEKPTDLTPTIEISNRQKAVETATDDNVEPSISAIPKRRSAGRPRRKPPQQINLTTSIDSVATNVDETAGTIGQSDIMVKQDESVPPIEMQADMQIESKAIVDVDMTEVPKECTTTQVMHAPTPLIEDDELLPKVENLVISADDSAKMEIDEEMVSDEPKLSDEPPFICSAEAMNTTIDRTTATNDNRIEIVPNDANVTVKEEAIDAIECNEDKPTELNAVMKLSIEENETSSNINNSSSTIEPPIVAVTSKPIDSTNVNCIKSEPIKMKEMTEVTQTATGVASNTIIIIPKELLDESDDTTSIRRSGRIKTINKSKQPAQGFGLVKEKKRFNDDDASNPSAERDADQTNEKDCPFQSNDGIAIPAPRQKTQEELEKEQIDRDNGLKLFMPIIDNEYRSERVISKEAKKMACDCFMTPTEMDRGELGCGDDCLNRMLLIECGPRCNVGDRCTNKRFQRHDNADCTIFKTEKKGYGLIASSYIPAGVFIMEYVGEVLNSKQFGKRANDYSKQMNPHYYFMALSSDCVIDATRRGNISRFINHSCDPNAETQKWTVNGELRIGFFSSKPILPDEEITFDYQFQRYGKEAQRCYCEASMCRGWIGGEPDSDDDIDDDDDEEESDEDATVESAEGNDAKFGAGNTDDAVTVKESGAQKKPKAAPKPKKAKDTTKKPVRKERVKATRKITKDFKKHMKRSEIMEDPDLDKEIDILAVSGLKNQLHTLQVSRLMVRAKLQKAKSRLLQLLQEAELPCRRLFLDYHGLKLIHSWMSDSLIVDADRLLCLAFRLDILRTLEVLPVKNKTMLQDSKVLSTVQRWTNIVEYTSDKTNNKTIAPPEEISPCDSGSGTPLSNDGVSSPKIDETSAQIVSSSATSAAQSSSTAAMAMTTAVASIASAPVKSAEVMESIPQMLEQNSALKGLGVDMLKRIISTNEKNSKIIEDSETNDKLPDGEMGKLIREIRLLASKLVTSWEQLPESFKIPKKLRIEQMKEHEREADQSYKETVHDETQKQSSTVPPSVSMPFSGSSGNSSRYAERSRDRDKCNFDADSLKEKDPRYRRYGNSTLTKHQRRQLFEAKVAQDNAERKKSTEQVTYESKCAFFKLDPRKVVKDSVPFCVNTATGQWYGENMKPIPTPPSHAHIKPPPPVLPTDINEYHIPPIDLPDQWKYAINSKGQIYYYHKKILIPQWEPPIRLLPLMEEQRLPEFEFRIESSDRLTAASIADDDQDAMKNDSDDDDEDLVSILSHMKMNAKRLLQLKSDPILEKNIDDDSSSSTSDDSAQQDLEIKLNFLKEKTEAYWENMKKLPNLSEEIAAMAKIDSGGTSSPANANTTSTDQECDKFNSSAQPSDVPKSKKRGRDKLVQEFRISPLSDEMKRELRRDSKRYKENKAKLRRQKDLLLKRKSNSSSSDAPIRKLKKITEGLPYIPKFDDEESCHTPFVSTLSARISALASGGIYPMTGNAKTSNFKEPASLSLSLSSSPASLTQSIVNKLPSIGHKFVSDTKELIAKNAMKPIAASTTTTTTIATTATTAEPNDAVATPTVPVTKHKKSTTMPPRKSSPKPVAKKKKSNDSTSEPIEAHSSAAKKIKERFRTDISGDIVRHLKPYFSETCELGRILTNEDFKHLARKLTFFVMLKELKYCNDVKVLEVTESVKVKAREYIKKYMSKFGQNYVRAENEQDYEDL